jgi:hypothetical protein
MTSLGVIQNYLELSTNLAIAIFVAGMNTVIAIFGAECGSSHITGFQK